jgi:hypothetical protein
MPENENEQDEHIPGLLSEVDQAYERWAREPAVGADSDEVTVDMHILMMQLFRAGWEAQAAKQADPESVASAGLGFIGIAGYEAEISVELNGMKGSCFISHLFFEAIKEHWDKATQAEHGLGYQECLALDEANFNAGLPAGSTPIPSTALPPGHDGDHQCPCGERWLVLNDAD